MGRYLIGCLMVLFFAMGCKEGIKSNDSVGDKTNQNGTSFKRVISDGDYNFQMEYDSRRDTSYFDIMYKGKKASRHGFKGKILNEMLGDLDRNQKNEVYIVVEEDNDTKLFGFLFEEGKAIEIKKGEHRKASQIKAPKYKVERHQLVERYTNTSEGGEQKFGESRYNLVKEGTGFVLLPQGWQSFELNAKAGEYYTKTSSGVDYYNVMVLGKRDGGKWKVEIQVKRKSDKKVLCSFTAMGDFVDRDLFVPLNQVDPELKGTLLIRFVNSMAVVYTEDKADIKEMTAFCPEMRSISGNFLQREYE